MIYIKIHETEHGAMIAMCDEKVLGKIYKDKKTGMILDLIKYSEFYKGELFSAKKGVEILKGTYLYSGNIVGEEAVSVVIKAGLATGSEIKKIDNVPSIQIFKIL